MAQKDSDRAFLDALRKAPAIRRRGRVTGIIVGSLMLIGGSWLHFYNAQQWAGLIERAKASGLSPLEVEPAEFGYRLGKKTGYVTAAIVLTGTLAAVSAGMSFIQRRHENRTVTLLLRYADQLEAAGKLPDQPDRPPQSSES